MRELLSEMGDGKSLDESMSNVYSRGLASFESEFIRQLTAG